MYSILPKCKKGDYCNFERQVDADGIPIPVRPDFLEKYDEAVLRFNENKAQGKGKPTTKEKLESPPPSLCLILKMRLRLQSLVQLFMCLKTTMP